MNPRVIAVRPMDGHLLELDFANGETRRYDCTPHLDFGVFRELADLSYFRRARVEGGTVVWPNEQDICPDTLHEDSVARWNPRIVSGCMSESRGRLETEGAPRGG